MRVLREFQIISLDMRGNPDLGLRSLGFENNVRNYRKSHNPFCPNEFHAGSDVAGLPRPPEQIPQL